MRSHGADLGTCFQCGPTNPHVLPPYPGSAPQLCLASMHVFAAASAHSVVGATRGAALMGGPRALQPTGKHEGAMAAVPLIPLVPSLPGNEGHAAPASKTASMLSKRWCVFTSSPPHSALAADPDTLSPPAWPAPVSHIPTRHLASTTEGVMPVLALGAT